MQLRQLQSGDVEVGCWLVQQFDSCQVLREHMARFLSNSTNYLLVAEEQDEIIGFLSAHRLDSLKRAEPALFIYEVEVAQPYRRRGVGKALIEYIRHLAIEAGCFEMYVFTNYSNAPARALYGGTGGQTEGGDELMFVYPLPIAQG